MNRFSGDQKHAHALWAVCFTLGLLVAVSTVALVASAMAQDDATTIPTVLSFSTMLGDPGTATPSAAARNVIRGYEGPSSPWLIRNSIRGELKRNGEIEVTVRGLVLPNGSNPVPFFRAALSCQDPANSTKGKLFFTQPFPADAAGNSNIAATLKLPTHCIAPIILITSPAVAGNANGFWFAVTGF